MNCIICNVKLDETPWYRNYYRCPKCYRIARASVMDDLIDNSARFREGRAHE